MLTSRVGYYPVLLWVLLLQGPSVHSDTGTKAEDPEEPGRTWMWNWGMHWIIGPSPGLLKEEAGRLTQSLPTVSLLLWGFPQGALFL